MESEGFFKGNREDIAYAESAAAIGGSKRKRKSLHETAFIQVSRSRQPLPHWRKSTSQHAANYDNVRYSRLGWIYPTYCRLSSSVSLSLFLPSLFPSLLSHSLPPLTLPRSRSMSELRKRAPGYKAVPGEDQPLAKHSADRDEDLQVLLSHSLAYSLTCPLTHSPTNLLAGPHYH